MSLSALLFSPSFFFCCFCLTPACRSLFARAWALGTWQLAVKAGLNRVPGGSCLFPLGQRSLLGPLESRFFAWPPIQGLWLLRLRSPCTGHFAVVDHQKSCTSIPLLEFFLSPLYYLDSFCGTSRSLSVGLPFHRQTFFFLFSLFFSPTLLCPSKTAVVATISPVTQ